MMITSFSKIISDSFSETSHISIHAQYTAVSLLNLRCSEASRLNMHSLLQIKVSLVQMKRKMQSDCVKC